MLGTGKVLPYQSTVFTSSVILKKALKGCDDMAAVFPSSEKVVALESMQKQLHASIHALSVAAEAIQTDVSPQVARSVQATENAWRAMEREFGLLSGHEIAEQQGSKAGTSLARDWRRKGKLLGIQRRNKIMYPGFQFNDTAEVYPVIVSALARAHELGVDDESLARWFCNPSATLNGLRPADVMEDQERIMVAFEAGFGVEW